MQGSDDRHQEPSDLDATDLAAIRKAMQGLRRQSPVPQSQVLQSQVPPSPAPPSPAPPSLAESPFSPRYPHLESWVNEFFVLTFGRTGDHVFWCDKWWDHAEAVLRLDALWRTWEAAALDPVHGMAAWLRDHLDPNLAVLLSSSGPFSACRHEHHAATVLSVSPTPAGWWSAPAHWWDVLDEDDR